MHAAFLFSSSFAASFDCTKANHAVEKKICADNELSRLDHELGDQYRKALARTRNPDAVVAQQRNWLKQQRNTCQDLPCLKAAYISRITDLTARTNSEASTCPITEQVLLGEWKGIGTGDFDEIAFESDGEKQPFLSWRHHRLEMAGSWKLENCVIHIVHPNNSKISFDYKITRYVRNTIYLQAEDSKENSAYRRIK